MQLAAQLLEHRSLIWKRTLADLRYRYSATAFGVLWTVLHPLALIATYSLVFGLLVERSFGDASYAGVPFPIVLCAGLLPWLGLTECVTRSANAFRRNAAYLKKLPVPETVFIGQVALTAAVEMAISLGLLIAVALCFGVGPSAAWLLLPLPLLALMLLGFGLGLAVGTWCAFLPDVGEVVPLVLRVGMWLVPVVLPFAVYADHGLGWAVAALPPTPSLFAVRELLIAGRVPGPVDWIAMAAWAAAACALGGAVLDRLRPELRDVL